MAVTVITFTIMMTVTVVKFWRGELGRRFGSPSRAPLAGHHCGSDTAKASRSRPFDRTN